MADNIRTFNAPQLGLRPTEIGVEATAAAARRIGAFSNQTAEALTNVGARLGRAGAGAADAVDDAVTHHQVHAGAANFMGLVSGKTNEWNEIAKSADPNDTSIKDKFIEENLNPALDQFEQSFLTEKGRRWAEGKTQALRQHMFEKTSADMSALAADAVHQNVNKTVNLGINTVTNDPSSLDFVRDSVKGSIADIAGSSPNLSPQSHAKVVTELSDKAEREIVHAAISGMIAKGGDWQKVANDPKNAAFINRPELDTFVRAEKVQQRHDEMEAKQAKIVDQQNTDRMAGEQINSIINGITYDESDQPNVPKGTVKALADVLRKNPTVSERVRKDIQGEIARVGKTQGQVIKSDNETIKSDLNTRMMDPDNPTTRLQILEAQDKLTPRTFRQLEAIQKEVEQGHLHDPAWKAVMQDSKSILGTDPIGAGKHGAWAPEFMKQYLAAKRAGTLEPNALSLGDKTSMISKSLENYKRTPQQMMVDRVAHGLISFDGSTPAAAIGNATGVKATTIRQGGNTYVLQPDGTYK